MGQGPSPLTCAESSLPLQPPRSHYSNIEANESEEVRQFRKLFAQLAGDVSQPTPRPWPVLSLPRPSRQPLHACLVKPGPEVPFSFPTRPDPLFAALDLSLLYPQDMEVSATELMNILNKVVTRREYLGST